LIHRFLQHLLPPRFRHIPRYGWMGPRVNPEKRDFIRQHHGLDATESVESGEQVEEKQEASLDEQQRTQTCRFCNSDMHMTGSTNRPRVSELMETPLSRFCRAQAGMPVTLSAKLPQILARREVDFPRPPVSPRGFLSQALPRITRKLGILEAIRTPHRPRAEPLFVQPIGQALSFALNISLDAKQDELVPMSHQSKTYRVYSRGKNVLPPISTNGDVEGKVIIEERGTAGLIPDEWWSLAGLESLQVIPAEATSPEAKTFFEQYFFRRHDER